MSDFFNGWPEDGEPVTTLSDEEMVEWANANIDRVRELEAENERLTAEVSRKDAAIAELWTIADTRDLDAEMALYVGGIVAEAMERDSGKEFVYSYGSGTEGKDDE